MLHPRRLPGLLALSLLLALVATAGVASAAVAPGEWQSVDVTLFADENPPLYLAAGVLPAAVTLPADVQLLAPTGAQPQWVGEILGQDPSMDVSVESSVTTEGANSIYSFQATRSRTVQLEALLPNAVTVDGDLYRASVTWPSRQDAAEVRLSARLPKDAKIVEPAEGATLVTDDPTANYYTRTFTNVKAGNPVSIAFAYQIKGIGASSSRGSSTLLVLLLVGLVVALVALGFVLVRSRRAGASDNDLEGSDAFSSSEPPSKDVEADESGQPDGNSADGSDGEESDNPEATAFDDGGASRRRGVSPKLLMGVLVTGAILIAGVAAAMNGTAPKASAEGITKQFAPGEACAVAEIPTELRSKDEAEAKRIFAAVENVPGVVYGTVRVSESLVEIGYCESEATEDQLRAAIAQAGFTLGAPLADPNAPAGSEASGTP